MIYWIFTQTKLSSIYRRTFLYLDETSHVACNSGPLLVGCDLNLCHNTLHYILWPAKSSYELSLKTVKVFWIARHNWVKKSQSKSDKFFDFPEFVQKNIVLPLVLVFWKPVILPQGKHSDIFICHVMYITMIQFWMNISFEKASMILDSDAEILLSKGLL